jgi:hypothetical protein
MRKCGMGASRVHTPFCFGLCVSIVVAFHSVQEFLPTFGMPDMFHADIHALLDVAIANDFVDKNAYSMRGYIVHDSSSPMRQIRRSGRLREVIWTDPW